mmetsp:Transcript_30104/g.82702  ORF Transcript_30104/g.82702 Transcript_30104/m.82702 type:complete len:143 (-) Transcript_30104:261-689(-)|eukprot:CAMPEP_0168736558 /NCGR_PEP_ID=MMETSP0724-20121128/9922_1 /TAXON_ID=265536 /ORGANISM="Amphiprora sp., Strain CCMP467" /LENGTH=142 /DNA_ID=CAMNT_0008783759 /DNA_START=232 /DNA_END=660 /DNA_ORIENTATION=+
MFRPRSSSTSFPLEETDSASLMRSSTSSLRRLDSLDSSSSSSSSFLVEDDALSSSSSPLSSSSTTTSRRTIYHPVISSMVRPNTLQNCHQVQDMMQVCGTNRSNNNHNNTGHQQPYDEELSLCHTAKRYHEFCLSSSSLGKK